MTDFKYVAKFFEKNGTFERVISLPFYIDLNTEISLQKFLSNEGVMKNETKAYKNATGRN